MNTFIYVPVNTMYFFFFTKITSFVTPFILCYTSYVNIELYSTFAGHIWASYSSYEDDIDTNRILIQKTTSLTVRNPPFELSGIGL